MASPHLRGRISGRHPARPGRASRWLAWGACAVLGLEGAVAQEAPPAPAPAPGAPAAGAPASPTPDDGATIGGPSDAELARLADLLGADTYAEREAATEALLEAGEVARSHLERALASPDPEVRFRARFLLGAERRRIEGLLRAVRQVPGRGARARAVVDPNWKELVALGPRAVPALLDCARSAMDAGDRRRAGIALRAVEELGGPSALPGLASLAEHEAFPVYLHVIAPALGAVAGDGPELAAALAGLMRHRDERVRGQVVDLLAALGQRPGLAAIAAAALHDASPEIRARAVDALVATGGREAAPRLLELLDGATPDVQARIIDALAGFGAAEVAPRLRPFLALPDAVGNDPRLVAAIRAAGALRDREAAPRLIELAGARSPVIAPLAIHALGALGARAAVPLFTEMLAAKDRPDRERPLLLALGQIGDASAAGAVAAYLEGGGRFKREALVCLGELKSPDAGAALVARFKEAEGSEASAALQALVALGEAAWLAEAALVGVSKSGADVRTTSAQLLGRHKPEGAFEALKTLAEDPSQPYSVHYRVMEALGELQDPRAIPVLEGLVKGGPLRRDAARALSRLGASGPLSEEVEADLARLSAAGAEDLDGRNGLGIDLTYLGRFDEAEAQFKVMLEADPTNNIALYNLGCVASLAGKPDKAVDYLRQSFERGYADWQHMELDRDLDALRKLPSYQALLRDMKRGVAAARLKSPGVLRFDDLDHEFSESFELLEGADREMMEELRRVRIRVESLDLRRVGVIEPAPGEGGDPFGVGPEDTPPEDDE